MTTDQEPSTEVVHRRNGHTKRSRKPKPVQALSADASAFIPSSAAETSNAESTRSENKPRRRGGSKNKGISNRRSNISGVSQSASDTVIAAQHVNEETDVSTAQSKALVDTVKEAETIMDRIQIALLKNVYECCICCDIIKRHQPVFEDQKCWAVFHLSCISKWAKRAMSPETGPPADSWRCPACNSSNTGLPGAYSCWCTKVLQPEPSRTSPHSCGQTCGKLRDANCPHPCSLPCHPGPCAPCTSLGPQQQCFCGKNSTQRRCVDTDYAAGSWSCQEICDELMPCDKHTCHRRCHPGLCGACVVLEEATCLCGQETKPVACDDQDDVRPGVDQHGDSIIASWTGSHLCAKKFDCGIHSCTRTCHIKEHTEPSTCPLSPEMVTTCYCGQVMVKDLLEQPRGSCSDPVPMCDNTCSKALACGHTCQATCHEGPCPECAIEIDVPCQCQSTQVSTTCQDMQLGLQPSCDRVCRLSLSCARHICLNKCCSGLPLGQERISRRPKGRGAAQLAARMEEIEAEHFCTKPCGKPLSCGNHSCGVICHTGPCPSCLVASFDDLTCRCGRTAIAAPVACGTLPPPCSYPCNRVPSCGHPIVPHNCHLDDVECPRCPYLVQRLCMCTKAMIKNQPCWKTTVSCGQLCNNELSCGIHQCKKRCHPEGLCEEPCTQTCGKIRSGCGHPCTEPCHTDLCPQDGEHPCKASVTATCACGNTKMGVRCNSQESDPKKQLIRVLKCTEFCAIMERNKKLSSALGISETHKPAVQTVIYEDETIDYYRDNKIWCSTIEQDFRTFVASPDKIKNFKAMKADLRKFVHEMAETYKMRSESMDEEPKRSVQLIKTEHTAMPPKSLAQASATKSTTTKVNAESAEKRRGQAYNAMVLVALTFGITKDELLEGLESGLSKTKLTFDISITEDGEYAYLQPNNTDMSLEDIEVELAKVRPGFRQVVLRNALVNTAELCWILKNGVMAYRETKKSSKAFSMKNNQQATKTRNAFEALSLDTN